MKLIFTRPECASAEHLQLSVLPFLPFIVAADN